MEIDLSQFHTVFFEESLEGLDSMEQELLNLEEDSDKENINTIFRVAHSIKGGSATFNFSEIAEFTHVLETLLDQMREGERAVTREIIDLLLKSVDCLRGMLNDLQDEKTVGDEYLSLVKSFNAILANGSSAEQQETIIAEENESSNDSSHSRWSIKFKPKEYILETGNEPYRMLRELKGLGQLETQVDLSQVPSFEALKPESCFLSWQLQLDADVEIEAIREVFEWIEDDCELIIESITADNELLKDEVLEDKATEIETNEKKAAVNLKSDEQDSSSAKKAEMDSVAEVEGQGSNSSSAMVELSKDKPTNEKVKRAPAAASIRVGTDKIDTLIDLVGELVITQSMLGELGTNFDMSKISALIAGLSELEQNTRELQESVMRIRMLPIGFVFNRLPRMVRDLSSQLGKKVDLEINGESTELDKTVMEQIGDPLTHLVRNALDHGLESIDKRTESGKSEEGHLTLNAFHQGGNIVIQVADDGRGIDPKVIFAKAVDKGLVNEETELSREQTLALIMEPGFSTAEVISDVSGRGVGMDVVKRNINNLGGSVEIASELGKGTTFTIRLPLTLAILDGQLIKVGSEIYVVPLVAIIESIPLTNANILMVAGKMPVYKLHDEYVPVVNLSQEFELSNEESENSDGLLAIVEGENRKIALRIDQLLGQQQVVIKSLETHYKSIQGVSGATILGDGRVSLILDVVGLSKRAAETLNHRREQVA